jgi:hypothetical protein
MVEFGRLTPDGYEHVKTINQSDMLKCPHVIMVAEHYRDDGTCRCNDPTHIEMAEWGYKWNGHLWISDGDESDVEAD